MEEGKQLHPVCHRGVVAEPLLLPERCAIRGSTELAFVEHRKSQKARERCVHLWGLSSQPKAGLRGPVCFARATDAVKPGAVDARQGSKLSFAAWLYTSPKRWWHGRARCDTLCQALWCLWVTELPPQLGSGAFRAPGH